MVEAAKVREAPIERALPGVAERRMTEIVAQRRGLCEILVERQRPRERARDLRHLERMGQPRAEMIALVIDEHLGLVGKPAECRRMDDAVAVAAKVAAGRARRLDHQPAPAERRIGGEARVRRTRLHHD